MLPAERRAVGVIALIGMLRMFGLFALLPVSCRCMRATFLDDATPLLIGLAVGAYGLTQAGLQIPLGALSDRIGRVPVIVAWSRHIRGIGSLIAAFSDTIWGVILGRLLQGAGAISATLTALISDATRDGRADPFDGRIRYRCGRRFHAGDGLRPPVFRTDLVSGAVPVRRRAGDLRLQACWSYCPQGIERPSAPQRLGFPSGVQASSCCASICTRSCCTRSLTASFVALPFLFRGPAGTRCRPITGRCTWVRCYCHWPGPCRLIIRDEHQGKGSTIGIAVSADSRGPARTDLCRLRDRAVYSPVSCCSSRASISSRPACRSQGSR